MRPVERRSEQRAEVQLLRSAAIGGAIESSDAALVEISVYGCRVACSADVSDDEPVRLSLGGSLPIASIVVWSGDGMIGCRFDTPIGRPLLRSLTIGR